MRMDTEANTKLKQDIQQKMKMGAIFIIFFANDAYFAALLQFQNNESPNTSPYPSLRLQW